MAVDKKNAAVQKAAKAAKANKVGTVVNAKKIRTSPRFLRPHTLRLARTPKYVRNPIPCKEKFSKFAIIKSPLFTDSSMKAIENCNTLTFLVNPRANKNQIRKAIKDLHDVEVVSINTLIRPDGQKKAFCRLHADVEAIDVANRIGFI